MNPQLNKVFSKLAKEDKKTELASEKVELGIMQDLSKAVKKHIAERKSVDNALDKWFNDLFKVRDRFGKIEGTYKSFTSSTNDMKKFVKEVEKMAKDLGINPTAVDEYNEAKSLIGRSEDIDDVMKEAKKLEGQIG